MFNLPTIRLGRVFGIPLEVNPTWLIIFVLVVLSLTFGYLPSEQGIVINLVSAIVSALLFFASIVAHELAHSLVARAGGIKIDRVTLFIFGGVASMEEEPGSPGREFAMAVAGPGMSLVLAGSFFAVLVLAETQRWGAVVTAPLTYLAFINFYVALFNLLPGFPLDGGRVLRAALWALTGDVLKATRWASRAGQFIGYAMVGVAVLGVTRGALNLIWLGLVGWFIASLAESAYRQQEVKTSLHPVAVSGIMSPDPMTAPGDITLESLAADYFLSGRHSRYPVLFDGSVIGLISLTQVKRVPREQWPHTRVVDVADKNLSSLVVDAAAPSDEIISRLAGDIPGALLVVESGLLVGIVTRADVLSRLQYFGSERAAEAGNPSNRTS